MKTLIPLETVLSAGQQIGGCRIIQLAGRGGMGEVYLAEHIALQRPVAVKVLRAEQGGAGVVDRFLREARTCCRIEHPHVVTVHDVGFDNGLCFIVMQYVDGLNLAELVGDLGGPLPWQAAVRVIRQAARGVGAVHEYHLIHRDIKPANIMLTRDSRVLLMDFGLVRDSAGRAPKQVAGTPAFISPEQCRGYTVDQRSDIFSLGATLYFLLAGEAPFFGTTEAIIERVTSGERPRDVAMVNAVVPRPLAGIVRKSMDACPRRRFSDVREMIAALGRLLAKCDS